MKNNELIPTVEFEFELSAKDIERLWILCENKKDKCKSRSNKEKIYEALAIKLKNINNTEEGIAVCSDTGFITNHALDNPIGIGKNASNQQTKNKY